MVKRSGGVQRAGSDMGIIGSGLGPKKNGCRENALMVFRDEPMRGRDERSGGDALIGCAINVLIGQVY